MQLDLMPSAPKPEARDDDGRLPTPFFLEHAARHQLDLPESWTWVQVKAIGRQIPSPTTCVTLRGPNRAEVKAVVSEGDVQAARARWEAETGRCGHCGGNGTTLHSYSTATGATWRECAACKGTATPAAGDRREGEA